MSVKRLPRPSFRHARLVASAPKSQTAHSLAAHPLRSPRAVGLPVSPLLVASHRGVTAWPQRTLVRELPPHLLPSPSPLLPLLLLPLLLRQHPLAAATFLLTSVVRAAVLLVAAGESVRPQLVTALLALILALPPLAAATKPPAAASVKTAGHLLPQVAAGSLLRAAALLSVSPSRALLPRVVPAMASTGPVLSSALGSRVWFH